MKIPTAIAILRRGAHLTTKPPVGVLVVPAEISSLLGSLVGSSRRKSNTTFVIGF